MSLNIEQAKQQVSDAMDNLRSVKGDEYAALVRNQVMADLLIKVLPPSLENVMHIHMLIETLSSLLAAQLRLINAQLPADQRKFTAEELIKDTDAAIENATRILHMNRV